MWNEGGVLAMKFGDVIKPNWNLKKLQCQEAKSINEEPSLWTQKLRSDKTQDSHHTDPQQPGSSLRETGAGTKDCDRDIQRTIESF